MNKLAIFSLLGLLVGGVAGFATGIFVYPFWFLNEVANDRLAPDASRVRLAAGEFVHVNKSDPVHWGKGMVSLHREGKDRTVLYLHEDFEVGPGPRFHVYLVDHNSVTSGHEFLASEKTDLGRLRAFRGGQIYNVPGTVDVSRFRSVVIWCKEFGVLISPASLMTASGTIPPTALK